MNSKEIARQKINKIKESNLGDADSLERMTKTLDAGSDLEKSDREYLRKLYRQYRKENEKPGKITGIGYAVIIVLIVIIVGGVMFLLPSEPEAKQNISEKAKPSEETKSSSEEKVWKFIENYKGKDNSGLTLNETIVVVMEGMYPGENILASPSTAVHVLVLNDYRKEVSDRYWKVEINIDTYREEVHLEWIVDTETNSLYPANEVSKSVLDILDNFDK